MDDAPRSEGAGHRRPSYRVYGELPDGLRGLGAGVGPGGLGRLEGAADQTHLGADCNSIPSEPSDMRGVPGALGQSLWATLCVPAAQLRRSTGGSARCLTRSLSLSESAATAPDEP